MDPHSNNYISKIIPVPLKYRPIFPYKATVMVKCLPICKHQYKGTQFNRLLRIHLYLHKHTRLQIWMEIMGQLPLPKLLIVQLSLLLVIHLMKKLWSTIMMPSIIPGRMIIRMKIWPITLQMGCSIINRRCRKMNNWTIA